MNILNYTCYSDLDMKVLCKDGDLVAVVEYDNYVMQQMVVTKRPLLKNNVLHWDCHRRDQNMYLKYIKNQSK